MPKILLVDDDLELTELLSELLSLEGFDTEIAYNGQEALNVLAERSFDLILLDVMMPVLNGIETIKQVRQKYDVPVLMLSARNSEIDKVLGLELGADDYLPKPFNDRELVARIKAILRRTISKPAVEEVAEEKPQTSEPRPNYFAGVSLNPARQEASYNEQNLDLTGTEFALLQLLIRHQGQILTREFLSTEVLGKELTAYDRAIDMHMSNLRRKLPDRNDNLPWFKTLRGRGYLLVVEG